MALFGKAIEGVAESGALTTAAVGIGVLFLLPRALPLFARALRPAAVAAIKAAITAYNEAAATLSQTASEVRQATEGLVAEAPAELEMAGAPPSGVVQRAQPAQAVNSPAEVKKASPRRRKSAQR